MSNRAFYSVVALWLFVMTLFFGLIGVCAMGQYGIGPFSAAPVAADYLETLV